MRVAKVKKITKITKNIPNKKYDITVKDNHNFFANSILVHNCSTLAKDFYHARSITDGALTPKQAWSREWIKSLWGSIRYELPDDMRIHGENLYAEHSIRYENLPSYFFVFGISNHTEFLSWDEILEWCELLNLEHVPVIYEGAWNENIICSLWPFSSDFAEMPEGYVLRVREAFLIDDFQKSVAKFVRKNHVQTDETWFKGEWLSNKLRNDNE